MIVLDADFGDRFDLKARFNANLGNVLNVDENFDVYPGLSLSLKNFGGHLGARYFFSNGFGVFTEATFPLAKYSNDKSDIGVIIFIISLPLILELHSIYSPITTLIQKKHPGNLGCFFMELTLVSYHKPNGFPSLYKRDNLPIFFVFFVN